MSRSIWQARTNWIDWGRQVLEIAQVRNDKSAARGIELAMQQFAQENFVLTIVGKAKRGKSTLLNALLGRKDDQVAPIDRLPASSAISRFRWGETEQAQVTFRNGQHETIPFSRIREFVTEELNPNNGRQVDVVDVEGPFAGLERDLVLVDTPGASSLHEYHDDLLHAFLPQSDAVIFLVTARMPLDQDELELLRALKTADIRKVFFAINRVDEATTTDLADAAAHNQKLLADLGVSVERLHRISGKKAFLGDVAASGVDELLDEINTFLANHKAKLLEARFVTRVCQQIVPVAQALDVAIASARRSATELDDDLAKLEHERARLSQDRSLSEREFSIAWTRALDDFGQALREARPAAEVTVVSAVESTPLTKAGRLAKELPTIVSNACQEKLAPAASRLEEALRSACEKLDSQYPTVAVTVSQADMALGTSSGSNTLFAGSLGGAALATTGVGLVAAGSTAAASIAAANAAAVAATTVTVPTVASSILGSIPYVGGVLGQLATGTAIVGTPAAVATTPLWVAISGPVGWTLAGIGALTVPFAWRVSKLRQKSELENAAKKQVTELFQRLETDRIPALKRLGTSIIEEFQLCLDRQLAAIESSLIAGRDHRPDEQQLHSWKSLAERLQGLLSEAGALSDDTKFA